MFADVVLSEGKPGAARVVASIASQPERARHVRELVYVATRHDMWVTAALSVLPAAATGLRCLHLHAPASVACSVLLALRLSRPPLQILLLNVHRGDGPGALDDACAEVAGETLGALGATLETLVTLPKVGITMSEGVVLPHLRQLEVRNEGALREVTSRTRALDSLAVSGVRRPCDMISEACARRLRHLALNIANGADAGDIGRLVGLERLVLSMGTPYGSAFFPTLPSGLQTLDHSAGENFEVISELAGYLGDGKTLATLQNLFVNFDDDDQPWPDGDMQRWEESVALLDSVCQRRGIMGIISGAPWYDKEDRAIGRQELV